MDVAGEIGVDDILACHSRSQFRRIKHAALNDAHAFRPDLVELAGIAQKQGQGDVAFACQHRERLVGNLAARTEDEDLCHLASL